jgi:exosome complex RNA-binding protein Csl4
MTPATATTATLAAPRTDPAFLSAEVLAAAPDEVVLEDDRRVVEVGAGRTKVLLEAAWVMAARCRVSVLVRVRVLVEVVVVSSSATAASGTRRAVRSVGRCILLKVK